MTLTDEFLNEQRQRGDSEADFFVDSIFSAGHKNQLYETLAKTDKTIIQQAHTDSICAFLTVYRPIPSWLSIEKLNTGQQVFKKYALDIMTLLGVLALPYCYAASPGNKALYLTAKMRKAPGKRLIETADFIINVMSPGTFDKNGSAYIQINKIRLIHSLARYYLTKGDWNMEWGLPINQEDMAGTNLAFSYVILTGLTRTAFSLTDKEQESFLHVWRYVGYQMHIADELLPSTIVEARLLETKIKRRHFKPSQEGKTLTEELIKHYKSYFPTVPAYFVSAQMRYLLGGDISELLGIPREPMKEEVLKSINAMAETVNQFYSNPSGYEKMLANHEKLKKQFV